jgi:hypothetical protein
MPRGELVVVDATRRLCIIDGLGIVDFFLRAWKAAIDEAKK